MRKKLFIKHGIPVEEFKALFEDGITVKTICEDLYSVKWVDSAQEVASNLKIKGFDVAGIRNEKGLTCGYIRRQDLKVGTCGDYTINFDETLLMSDSTPLINAFYLLSKRPYWFILKNTSVESIVTRADLQKPPVRILIFGIITLLDMNLTELIRRLYGESEWTRELSLEELGPPANLCRPVKTVTKR